MAAMLMISQQLWLPTRLCTRLACVYSIIVMRVPHGCLPFLWGLLEIDGYWGWSDIVLSVIATSDLPLIQWIISSLCLHG